jgi:hypothetical protein
MLRRKPVHCQYVHYATLVKMSKSPATLKVLATPVLIIVRVNNNTSISRPLRSLRRALEWIGLSTPLPPPP